MLFITSYNYNNPFTEPTERRDDPVQAKAKCGGTGHTGGRTGLHHTGELCRARARRKWIYIKLLLKTCFYAVPLAWSNGNKVCGTRSL